MIYNQSQISRDETPMGPEGESSINDYNRGPSPLLKNQTLRQKHIESTKTYEQENMAINETGDNKLDPTQIQKEINIALQRRAQQVGVTQQPGSSLQQDSSYQDHEINLRIEADLQQALVNKQKFSWHECSSVKRQFPININHDQMSLDINERAKPASNYYIEEVMNDKVEYKRQHKAAIALDKYTRDVVGQKTVEDMAIERLKKEQKQMQKTARNSVRFKKETLGDSFQESAHDKTAKRLCQTLGSDDGVGSPRSQVSKAQTLRSPRDTAIPPPVIPQESPNKNKQNRQKYWNMETTLVPVSAATKKIDEAAFLDKDEIRKSQGQENIVSTVDQAEVQNSYIQRQENKIRNIGRTPQTGNIASQRAKTSGLESFQGLDSRVEYFLKQENRQNRLQKQMKISQELKFMAKQQLFMGQIQSMMGSEQVIDSGLVHDKNFVEFSNQAGLSTDFATSRGITTSPSNTMRPLLQDGANQQNPFKPTNPFLNKTGNDFFRRDEMLQQSFQSEALKNQEESSPKVLANNVPKSYLDDDFSAIRQQDKDSVLGSNQYGRKTKGGQIPHLSLPGRSSHNSGSMAGEIAASTGTAANMTLDPYHEDVYQKIQDKNCLMLIEKQQKILYGQQVRKQPAETDTLTLIAEPVFKKAQPANPFAFSAMHRTSFNKTTDLAGPLPPGGIAQVSDAFRNTRKQSLGLNPRIATNKLIGKFNQKIEGEIEDHLQGDAKYSNLKCADQRVLNSNNPNFFFVRKDDFNSPNSFNLNLLQPYPRSRIRVFVPTNGNERSPTTTAMSSNKSKLSPRSPATKTPATTKAAPKRNGVIDKIHHKFLNPNGVSSQIDGRKTTVVVDTGVCGEQAKKDKVSFDAKYRKQFRLQSIDEMWQRNDVNIKPSYINIKEPNRGHSMVGSRDPSCRNSAATGFTQHQSVTESLGLTSLANAQKVAMKSQNKQFNQKFIEPNRKSTLNTYDYRVLKQEQELANIVSQNGGERLQIRDEVKIPKIMCHQIASQFNEKVQENRMKRMKKAERQTKAEEKRGMMENVFKNLGRKDSQVRLLELYEQSLHQCDMVQESEISPDGQILLRDKEDFEEREDPYSSSVAEKAGRDLEKELRAIKDKGPPLNKSIVKIATKIRNQQNWVSKAQDVELEDFDGDDLAMLQFKTDHGIRKLTMDEKMIMFALFDESMRDIGDQAHYDKMRRTLGAKRRPKGQKSKLDSSQFDGDTKSVLSSSPGKLNRGLSTKRGTSTNLVADLNQIQESNHQKNLGFKKSTFSQPLTQKVKSGAGKSSMRVDTSVVSQ